MTPGRQAGSDGDAVSGLFGLLFGFRGAIGRGRYWIGLGVTLAVLIGAMGFAATAMNPTGSGAAILAIPCLLVAAWIFAAITLKRLRDTSLSRWAYPVIVLAPFLWLPVLFELIEHLTILVVPVQIFLFALPGLIRPRADAADVIQS